MNHLRLLRPGELAPILHDPPPVARPRSAPISARIGDQMLMLKVRADQLYTRWRELVESARSHPESRQAYEQRADAVSERVNRLQMLLAGLEVARQIAEQAEGEGEAGNTSEGRE